MIRHCDLRERLVATQNDVATALAFCLESNLAQGCDHFRAGHARQFAHTATTRASNLSAGTGSPSSSSASM
jgi:hypothetical protein